MATINTYLNFPGNTEEAFNFYKSVLGGDFQGIQRFKDTPEGDKMSENDQEKIMHIALPVGNNTLMGTDALESQGFRVIIGNNYHISLGADSEAEAEKFFNGFSDGGTIVMPMAKTFWNSYFGMCIDKYGISWMISFDYK